MLGINGPCQLMAKTFPAGEMYSLTTVPAESFSSCTIRFRLRGLSGGLHLLLILIDGRSVAAESRQRGKWESEHE